MSCFHAGGNLYDKIIQQRGQLFTEEVLAYVDIQYVLYLQYVCFVCLFSDNDDYVAFIFVSL